MQVPFNSITQALTPHAGGPTAALGTPAPDTQNATSAGPFADLFRDAVGQVNQLEDQAHAAIAGLVSGTGVDVHQAMIATEKSSMAFELTLSVRNKALQAYQQVMSMQF